MKKSIVLLVTLALVFALGTTVTAAPVVPNGLTVTPVSDFTAIADGDNTLSGIGCWTGGGESNVTVADGVITIESGVWGAFPNLTTEQSAIFVGKAGLGFYFAASESDAQICYGFNDTTGANYVMADDKPVLLAATDGTVTEVTTVMSSFNQGGIDIPASFEGYIYIPFSTFVVNLATDPNYTPFDIAVSQPATLIYVLGAGAPLSYGETVAYTGTYDASATEAPTDPGSETADISTIAYAAAALAGLGSLTLLRKKK